MTRQNFFRHAQFPADQPHFILEQLPQRLDQFQLHLLRQAADVVMTLDHGRRPAHRNRFDHVRIERALNQKANVAQALGFFFENIDEDFADRFSLLFRIGDALQAFRETVRRPERRRCSVSFAAAAAPASTQTHLRAADRCRQRCRSDDRQSLDAPAPRQQWNQRRRTVRRQPARSHQLLRECALTCSSITASGDQSPRQLANRKQKIAQHLRAERRVRNFGMKLHAVDSALDIFDRVERVVGQRGDVENQAALKSSDRHDSSKHPSRPADL